MAKKDLLQEYYEKLERISNLKDKGLISDEEYLRERQKLEKHKPKPTSTAASVVAFIMLGLVVWFIISVFNAPPSTPSPFVARLGIHKFIDPSTASVEVHVKNTGTVAAKPYCQINVSNDAGSYNGHGSFYGVIVEAGATSTFVENVKVSDDGALYITSGDVTCTVDN